MHKSLIILLILTLGFACQTTKNISDQGNVDGLRTPNRKNVTTTIELSKSIGVIFPKEYEPAFNRDRLANRFTPTEEEIREAEIDIENQYFESDKRFAYNQNFKIFGNSEDWPLEKREKDYELLVKAHEREAKESKFFDRQYLGFIENEQRILVIQFIDFRRDPHRLKKEIDKEFIFGFHDWFETNVRLKEFNLETKRLNAFGWPQL